MGPGLLSSCSLGEGHIVASQSRRSELSDITSRRAGLNRASQSGRAESITTEVEAAPLDWVEGVASAHQDAGRRERSGWGEGARDAVGETKQGRDPST